MRGPRVTKRLTLLFSAFEALLVVGIGIAIPLLPATVLWAAHFGFAPDWLVFWRAAVDIWLVGHGVDVTFVLDELSASAIGIPAPAPVLITIAMLGFAALTLALGVRAGGRIAETGHRVLGGFTTVGVFALLSLAATASSLHVAARPSLWQGAVLPALVFGLGVWIGVLRAGAERGPDAAGSSIRDWVADWTPGARAAVGAGLRAGGAAVAVTILVSAVAVAVLLVVGYAQVIRLYEALHTEVLGGAVLTAAQLAFVPNFVLWGMSWFVGPGFALGVGSHVSPLGTAVGPLPAIPVLGAVPTGELSFGFVGLVVPVVAAFLAGAAVRPALVRALGDGPRLGWFSLVTAIGAIGGGAVLGLLAAASAGAAGPGRFSEVGPDGWAVAIAATIEFAVGIALGLSTGALPRIRSRRTAG